MNIFCEHPFARYNKTHLGAFSVKYVFLSGVRTPILSYLQNCLKPNRSPGSYIYHVDYDIKEWVLDNV